MMTMMTMMMMMTTKRFCRRCSVPNVIKRRMPESRDADFRFLLDYRLLEDGDSPVVGEQLAMQGLNRVGDD